VTVIFPPGGGEPIRLRGIFSPADLLAAIDKAEKMPASIPATQPTSQAGVAFKWRLEVVP
jgi:hypothetical protein